MRVLALAVLLSGCSLVGGGSAEVGVLVALPAAGTGLDVEVTLDRRAVPLTPLPTTGDVTLFAQPVSAKAGPTPVACTVSGRGAASAVTTTLDVQEDWTYSLRCVAQPTDPTDGCFGCSASTSAALDPALGLPEGDRLWLYWTGSPEGTDVLY